ncbi:hypothetical protein H257_14623 [Aphanomyces astaci]|uniref:Uncharacterized protein n=1 Tax=Aphanomyces astaci TaxID=112090 RepID=W4FT16_APHAT|nr:hypothetical protein H257_14623 [Aphanomyces astaci]ETV69798.1 hypothetical protein H257_14623 [Aphanomyces astaci]|eukprot:XP_009840812.1 hypothetical protein H257_14623 [Aphanomyces astaci]
MSDKFGSYVSTNERHTLANNPALAGMDYSHQWVNHTENFVNPAKGAHTQDAQNDVKVLHVTCSTENQRCHGKNNMLQLDLAHVQCEHCDVMSILLCPYVKDQLKLHRQFQ